MRRLRFVFVVGVSLLAVSACSSAGSSAAPGRRDTPASTPATTTPPVVVYSPAGHHVTFAVSGTARSAHVAWANNGNITQHDEPLPWSTTETATGPLSQVVLVLNVDADSGTVTCTLTVDGQKVDEHTVEDGGHARCAMEPGG